MVGRLQDKVVIITGSANGQGQVAAEIFAREGACLVLTDLDEVGLQRTAALVRKSGSDPLVHVADLTEETAHRQLVDQTVKQHGRVDVLYNNAARVRFGSLLDLSLDDWRFTFENELTIIFLACKYAIPAMIASGGGSIINIASISGLYMLPGQVAHATMKAGVIGLTKQVAVEYGPQGIRCNAIAPSGIEYGRQPPPGAKVWTTAEDYPLRAKAQPHDPPYMALFLASDESSFVTGQVFLVDGGLSAT